jgi:hypothetical protein
MDDRLYKYVALSRVPKTELRFTNDPEERTERLVNDESVRFLYLRHPRTRAEAAEWLRDLPECQGPEWQEAIAYELRERR